MNQEYAKVPLYSAIIVAGGSGNRFGADVPKQYMTLNDIPILQYSMEIFLSWEKLSELIVVIREEDAERYHAIYQTLPHENHDKLREPVIGGKERYESVKNGLMRCNAKQNKMAHKHYVFIHDAARPLISHDILDALAARMEQGDISAALPAIPVADTLKLCDEFGNVVKTTDRKNIFCAQTPQLCDLVDIKNAYNKINDITDFTDDASALESLGHKVAIIKGGKQLMKVTDRGDLEYLSNFIA